MPINCCKYTTIGNSNQRKRNLKSKSHSKNNIQANWTRKKKKKIKVRKTNANAYAKNKKFNKNSVAGAIIYWPIVRLVHALRSKAHLFLVGFFFCNINSTGHGHVLCDRYRCRWLKRWFVRWCHYRINLNEKLLFKWLICA